MANDYVSLVMDDANPLGNTADTFGKRALHVKIGNLMSEPIPVMINMEDVNIGTVNQGYPVNNDAYAWPVRPVTLPPDAATETTLASFESQNHIDLDDIKVRIDSTNSYLLSIDTDIDVPLSTRATEATLNTFRTQNHTDLLDIESRLDTANTTLLDIDAHVGNIDSNINTTLSSRASESTLSTLNSKVNDDYGVSSGAVRTASQIGNSTGQASFGAGATSAQTLRTASNLYDGAANALTSTVVLATRSLDVNVSQSALPNGAATESTLSSVNTHVAAIDTHIDVNLSTRASESTLSTLNGKVNDDYGVSSGAVRTASQIGNTTGAANFNAGSTGAQTLRTTSNITRNGTELSYSSGTSDANTLRGSVNIKREGNDLDYNYGATSANTIRSASQIGNATGAADFNFGAVGAQTVRVAAEPGNATGLADFNAGATGAQTPRASVNITRNGTELSYNSGTSDANTLRASVNIKREGNDLDYNFGTVGANTLRVASEIGNATGAADFNYGTVGAQTVRTASQIGNATGAADFNNGATGAQTLRVSANQGTSPWVTDEIGFSTSSNTRPSVTSTSSTILSSNAGRKYAYVMNNSGATIYIKLGATAVVSQGIPISPGSIYEINKNNLFLGSINAIKTGATVSVDVYEGTT